MISYSFRITLTVDGGAVSVGSLTLEHTESSVFPVIHTTTYETIDLPDFSELSKISTFPQANAVIDIYSGQNAGATTLFKTITFNGIAIKMTYAEDERKNVTGMTLLPRAALSSFYSGDFDQISDKNHLSSGRYLINAIIAAYNFNNSLNQLSPAAVFSVKDFIPVVAPRFINMSYVEMMRRVAETRGLNIRIGFDNIVRVASFAKPHSTNIRISKDMLESSSVTSNLLNALAR